MAPLWQHERTSLNAELFLFICFFCLQISKSAVPSERKRRGTRTKKKEKKRKNTETIVFVWISCWILFFFLGGGCPTGGR